MEPLNDFPLHEEVGYREKSSKAMSGAASILFGNSKKSLQNRFFEDSYDYVNSKEYLPFKLLKF